MKSQISLDKYFNVYFSYDIKTLDKIRAVDGRKWQPRLKCWTVPVNIFNYNILQEILPQPIQIDKSVLDWYLANKHEQQVIPVDKINDWEFKTRPYKHQRDTFEWAIMRKSGCLFLECGTGKTKVMIDVMQFLFYYKSIKRALVVVPLSVVNSWKSELAIHSNITDYEILTDMPMKKRIEILNGTDKKLYIINYDAVKNMEEDIKCKKFDLCILDESTYIKSYKAQRTKALINISSSIPMRFCLTGTPFGQRVLDVYSQLKFACPQSFSESWFAFRNNYCELGGYQGKEITGNKNMPELESRIRNVAKVYRKVDCLDLPPKIYETRTCEMVGDQKTAYKEMLEYLFTIINKDTVVNVTSVLTQMMKLAQITGGFVFSNNTALADGTLQVLKDNPKLKLLEETLEEISGKVVIFCKFRHDIELIKLKLGGSCVEFTGDVSEENREAAIKKFNQDSSCMYFLATSAGGYGLNLQIAHTVVFYSHEWSVEKRCQMEDRVYRSGQKEAVTIIDLFCTRDGKQTIDGYVVAACKEKRDITSALVDAIKEKNL